MILVNDLRPGQTFESEGQIFQVVDIQHNKTAMRQMIVKVKVKNLRTGATVELNFTGGDKVEQAHIEKRKMQYLYDAGDALVFMDNETYEQVEINKDKLEWEMNFMKPNDEIMISFYDAQEVVGITLPDKVELRVVETEPAVRGDTANNAMKNAILETGWNVKVPLFIEQDEMVQVSTSDGKYAGRA